jgi:hypothetical protein
MTYSAMNIRRKISLIVEAAGFLSSVFFFDCSGIGVAWSLLSMAGGARRKVIT